MSMKLLRIADGIYVNPKHIISVSIHSRANHDDPSVITRHVVVVKTVDGLEHNATGVSFEDYGEAMNALNELVERLGKVV